LILNELLNVTITQVITNGNDIAWNNLITGNRAPLAVSVNLQEEKTNQKAL